MANVTVVVSKIQEGKKNSEIVAAIKALFSDPQVLSASDERYGKAFVNFATLGAAMKAVELLNGTRLFGNIVVAKLQGAATTTASPPQPPQRSPIQCHSGMACDNVYCTFVHSRERNVNLIDRLRDQAHNRHEREKMRNINESIHGKRESLRELSNEALLKAFDELAALEGKLSVAQQQLTEFRRACQLISPDNEGVQQMSREAKRLQSGLPFYGFRTKVVQAVRDNNVTVIIGDTGSGKSTQIAPFLLDGHLCGDGTRGAFLGTTGGKLVVTQPRKLAATELAARVAFEWGGVSGGRSIIGTFKAAPSHQKIEFCTDSKLLGVLRDNPLLDGIDCVVVDEVHERSISTDLLLGRLKGVLRQRPTLRVVLTSATMDREVFRSFYAEVCRTICDTDRQCPVPVVEVPGRTFPVDDHYEESEDDYVTFSWRKALQVHREQPPGDIIVFLATVIDIERACTSLKKELRIDDSAFEGDDALVLPLHGKLQPEENQRAFAPASSKKRKIIFSTSIAETSVTIDGVVYVVDSGMANVAGYDQVRNMTFLDVCFITKSSVRQRRGRAGRTQPGVCFHLYSEEQFMEMEDTQVPEIRRSNLTQTVLKLVGLFGSAGGNVHRFEFVEPPANDALDEALRSLDELGAVREVASASASAASSSIPSRCYALTDDGRHMLTLDQSPEICRMIFHGVEQGVQRRVVALAALLISGSYVFYRSGSEVAKQQADNHKATFCVRDAAGEFSGDWIAMLNVYDEWVKNNKDPQWSKDHFIVNKTIKMADKICNTLNEQLTKLTIVARDDDADLMEEETMRRLKKSICAGYFKNVSLVAGGSKSAGLKVARLEDRTVMLHPSSVLAMMGVTPKCVIYDELVRTSRYFIRGVTVVDVDTVIAISPRFSERIRLRDLSERTYVSCEFTNIGPALRMKIMGHRGKQLQELEKLLGVTVDMEAISGEATVRLWTSPNNLDKAREGFEAFLNECKEAIRSETTEVSIDALNVRAVVSAGCQVSMILRRNEYRKAIIRGLPANFPWARAAELFSGPAKITTAAIIESASLAVSDDGKSSWGYIVCDTVESCAELIHQLDKSSPSATEFDGCKLLAHPSGEVRRDLPYIVDSTVKVTWNTFTGNGKFFIQFTEDGFAVLALEKFRMVPLQLKDRLVPAEKQDGKRVYFRGADITIVEESIRKVLYHRTDIEGVESVSVMRIKPQQSGELQTDVAMFSSMFTSCGQVRSQSLFPINEKNGKGKAYIIYADRADAEKAIAEYDGKNVGGAFGVMRVVADISCMYRIAHFMYPKLKELLIAEKTRVTAMTNMVEVSGPVEKGLKGATIKITTCQHEALGTVKVGFDRILAGRTVHLEDPDDILLFRRRDGKMFLDKLNSSSPCFIQANFNTNAVRVYGADDDIEAAQLSIRQFVADSKAIGETVLKLSGADLHGLVGPRADGLSTIEAQSGASAIVVNWFRATVTIAGTEDAREAATHIINEQVALLAAARNARAHTDSDSSAPECRLCLVEPEDYTLLLCGRRCCRGCLRRMLEIRSRTDRDNRFPMRCPFYPAACEQMISLADIRACTDRTTFDSICSESTRTFIENAPQYRFCFAASCNGILPDLEAQRGFVRCLSCSGEFCSSCSGKDDIRGVPWHKGLTCAQFQSVQRDGGEDLLRQCLAETDGRQCPQCRNFVIRDIGCDHMTCLCRHEFCYVCGAPSKRSVCQSPCPGGNLRR